MPPFPSRLSGHRALRSLLLVTALVGCAPAPIRPPTPLAVPEGAVSFLVLGDWGRGGSRAQRAVAEAMGNTATALHASFVVTTGDNFYPDGVKSADDPQFQRTFERVYDAPALSIPWYPALGNHDYHQDPDAEIAYGTRHPRWHMPARYYSFTHEIVPGVTAEFLVMDSNPFNPKDGEDDDAPMKGADTVAQRRWLDSTLAASTAQWKFVVTHHHLYSSGPRGTNTPFERFLAPRLQRYHVTALLSGHEHHLEHAGTDSIGPQFFISGAGSETRSTTATPATRYVESISGFMAFSMSKDSVLVQVIGSDGTVRYRTVLRR
jgi:tartrate-resistant acid phosphatase type 5